MWISHKNPNGAIRLIDLNQVKEVLFYEECSKLYKDSIYHLSFYYKQSDHTSELIFNSISNFLKVIDLINKELNVIDLDTNNN